MIVMFSHYKMWQSFQWSEKTRVRGAGGLRSEERMLDLHKDDFSNFSL